MEQDKKKYNKEALHTFFIIFFTILVALFCSRFILGVSFVNGKSMQPTLENQQLLLVWKWQYQPQLQDVVVTDGENATGRSLVKRVWALPGQHVQIQNNEAFVDGVKIPGIIHTLQPVDLIVPQNHCFLLGDNLQSSVDSRSIGTLSLSHIEGKVIFPFV